MKLRLSLAFFLPFILNTLALCGTVPSTGSRTLNISSDKGSANSTSPSDATEATPVAPVPEPEVVDLANRILGGKNAPAVASSEMRGGLWLSGDVSEALDRLRWIVGRHGAQLLIVDKNGRVRINAAELAKVAGVDASTEGDAPLLLASYISEREGLFLMLQVTQSSHHYLLHIGRTALTAKGEVPVRSTVNLDNNFDSRINPRRPQSTKFDCERPPAGFDSEIAMNPITRWVNEWTREYVPLGQITFHELAEAYAKVEFGFDYLRQGPDPGAHELAIEREYKLLSRRQPSNALINGGPYLVLTSEKQIRRFEDSAHPRNEN